MKIKTRNPRGRSGKGWLLAFVLEILSLVIMWLVMVWGGIERTDTTYFINIAQNEVREKLDLHAKLEVEKERLLSPHELRRKAAELQMHEPRPGQVRRMESR